MILVFFFTLLMLSAGAYYLNINAPTDVGNNLNNQLNPPTEGIPKNIFVVPEIPFGTIGLMTALGAAFAGFIIRSKPKQANR